MKKYLISIKMKFIFMPFYMLILFHWDCQTIALFIACSNQLDIATVSTSSIGLGRGYLCLADQ